MWAERNPKLAIGMGSWAYEREDAYTKETICVVCTAGAWYLRNYGIDAIDDVSTVVKQIGTGGIGSVMRAMDEFRNGEIKNAYVQLNRNVKTCLPTRMVMYAYEDNSRKHKQDLLHLCKLLVSVGE